MNSKTFYNLTNQITNFIKEKLFQMLSAYLKSHYGGWLVSKLVDVAVDHLDKRVVDPVLDVLVVKLGHKFDVNRARKIIAIMEKANETQDERTYRQSVDDLIGGV